MNRILRTIVIFLAVLAAAALIVVYGFQIRHVTVEGNDRYSADQISSDLTSTSLLKNTLYFAWKYRSAAASPEAPYLTSVKASIQSPTSVKVTVVESSLIGRVQVDGRNVYFDENGIVQMITDEVRSGVPLVTGVDVGSPELYQKLPVANTSAFRTMLSITQLLIQSDFIPDSVSFDSSGNMTLRYGSVTVRLGQDEYLEEKIANLVQIYPKISSRTGTLNMEGFTGKNTSITFKETGKQSDETEGGDSGETLTGVGTDTGQTDASAGSDQGAGTAENGQAQNAGSQNTNGQGQDADSQNENGQGQDADSQNENGQGQNENSQNENSSQNSTKGVMAFDSNGTLHYDAHIENGQVVDASGNPIAGCTVDENGNIKDAYWNVIDPATGQLVQ